MKKYRTKTRTVEAVQFTGHLLSAQEIEKWLCVKCETKILSDTAWEAGAAPPVCGMTIHRPQGMREVEPRMFVVKEEDGYIKVYSPEIFAEEYPETAPSAEALAQRFHEAYESLAPEHGYETRKESAKPWSDVPENNKSLMIAVCEKLLTEGI